MTACFFSFDFDIDPIVLAVKIHSVSHCQKRLTEQCTCCNPDHTYHISPITLSRWMRRWGHLWVIYQMFPESCWCHFFPPPIPIRSLFAVSLRSIWWVVAYCSFFCYTCWYLLSQGPTRTTAGLRRTSARGRAYRCPASSIPPRSVRFCYVGSMHVSSVITYSAIVC